jgi:hypothetical protein
MNEKSQYYEFYGELVKSNIFFKRLVIFLVIVNIVLAYLGFLGFTRPVETYVVKEGYAYATEPAKEARSIHEVRKFTQEFTRNFLEYNRESFNTNFRAAMKMCTSELEYFMFDAIKNSDIPKIVQNTSGNIQFEIADIQVREASDFESAVMGRQVFPGSPSIPIKFTLQITIVPRTQDNPFGLRIINYTQEKA